MKQKNMQEKDLTNVMPDAEAEQQMSKGERIYNWAVYKGVNFWTNLISSIAIADYLINKNGRNHLDWAIGKLAKTVEATGAANLKTSYKHSKVALETLSLMSGGWALLIPMKLMEDRKRSIVHWINDKMGVDQTAPDGHKETPDEIYIAQEQPKQTWFNVIKRRVLATIAVVSTGQVIEIALADKKNKKPDHTHSINPFKPNSQTVTLEGQQVGGKAWSEAKIVGFVNKGMQKLPGGDYLTKKDSWPQRWLGLAALDTGFTKISAVVMHMTNGADKRKAKHEIGDDKSPPAEFEIGDELKANENKEAKPSNRAAESIIRSKDKSENFSAAARRSLEAAKNTHLSV